MMLNKGLNLDTLPENSETGDFRYAQNISLDSSFRFPINENGMTALGIDVPSVCGIIPFDKGMVIFSESGGTIYVIDTYNTETLRCKLVTNLPFKKVNPIRGTYTYNENKHLIICFSGGVNNTFEDCIIDVDAYILDNNKQYILSNNDVYKLSINPNVSFPKITSEQTTGSLLTGSYQIAVTYKLDKEYTNYSLLSLVEYVYDGTILDIKGTQGLKPYSISSKGIDYTLTNLDTHYKYCKLAIIYNDGITFKVYSSKDILINQQSGVNVFELKDLNIYEVISLDEVLAKSIFYSNSETLTILNNRLYRANLKNNNLTKKYTNGNNIYFDDVAQLVASSVEVGLESQIIDKTTISKSKQYIKFQNDEVYALYLTFGDKKGNILGSYPINSPYVTGLDIKNGTGNSSNPISYKEVVKTNTAVLKKEILPNFANFSLISSIESITGLNVIPYNDEITLGIDYIYETNSIRFVITAYRNVSTPYSLVVDFQANYEIYNGSHSYSETINNSVTIPANSLTGTFDFVIEADESMNVNFAAILNQNVNYVEYLDIDITSNISVESNLDVKVAFHINGSIDYIETLTILTGDNSATKRIPARYFDSVSILDTYTVEVQLNKVLKRDTEVVISNSDNTQSVTLLYHEGENIKSFTATTQNVTFHVVNQEDIDFINSWIETPYNLVKKVDFETDIIFGETTLHKTYSILTDSRISDNVLEQAPSNSTFSELVSNYGTDLICREYSVNSDKPMFETIYVQDSLYSMTTLINTIVTPFVKNTIIAKSIIFQKPLSNALHYVVDTFDSIDCDNQKESTYPDNIKNYYTIEKECNLNTNQLVDGDEVKYTTNYITVTLPNTLNLILGDFKNDIGFWCVHRAQRTHNNSRIYCQGILRANFNQYKQGSIIFTRYNKKHLDYLEWNIYNIQANGLRFYSFEDLFLKNDYFPNNSDYPLEFLSKYYNTDSTGSSMSTDILFNHDNNIFETSFASKTLTYNRPKLLESHNFSVYNLFSENCRQLKYVPSYVDDSGNESYSDTGWFYDFIAGVNGYNYTINHEYNNILNNIRCNILNNTSDYYRNIYDESLILCSVINKLSDISTNCKGDTFYSIFTNYFHICPTEEVNVSDIDNTAVAPNMTYPIQFFIESKYNIHARYWEGDIPKHEQPINTAEQQGYNKVYHLQSNQNATVIVDKNNNESRRITGLYPSRIIMSVKANAEKNILNFRKYLALDYYDMPYNRNSIVALLSTYKTLYIQQELGCFAAQVKDVISYTDGATYVGTGELFDRQPTEMIPTPYGFVGCENYFNTGITDKGIWIIDNVQGYIFFITDEGISIISDGKNKNYIRKHLAGNNPFINDGCYIVYDNSKNISRFILVSHRTGVTLSYIHEIKNWFSFHSYHPMYGTYTRNNTYLISNTNIDNLSKFTDTLKGKHSLSSVLYPSIISVYYNEEPLLNKLFETLYWNTKTIINNTPIYDVTFDKLFASTDTQTTPVLDINCNKEWFDNRGAILKKDLWLFNNLFDYVLDNHRPFLNDFINFVSNNIDSENKSLEWFEISKLLSTFVSITFIFDNYFYSIDGKQKSATANDICKYQPTIMLRDLNIDSKPDNR